MCDHDEKINKLAFEVIEKATPVSRLTMFSSCKETTTKVTTQKPCSAANKGPSLTFKKAYINSSESKESSESEDEV
ncbi:hypothetical protein EV1_013147 [Malus domestica]